MKTLITHAELLLAQEPAGYKMTALDDGRYCWVNGTLFDLTRWESANADGDYVESHIVSVFVDEIGDATCNATYGNYKMPASDFKEAFVFDNEPEAKAKFLELIAAKL